MAAPIVLSDGNELLHATRWTNLCTTNRTGMEGRAVRVGIVGDGGWRRTTVKISDGVRWKVLLVVVGWRHSNVRAESSRRWMLLIHVWVVTIISAVNVVARWILSLSCGRGNMHGRSS